MGRGIGVIPKKGIRYATANQANYRAEPSNVTAQRRIWSTLFSGVDIRVQKGISKGMQSYGVHDILAE